MANDYQTPGVYVEEVSSGAKPIESVSTTTAAFVGVAPKADAHVNEPYACNNWTEFVTEFCTPGCKGTHLAYGVYGFFMNGGRRCYVVNVGANGSIAGDAKGGGVKELEKIDEPSTVVATGCTTPADVEALLSHCEKMGDRIAIIDGPEKIGDVREVTEVGIVEPAPAGGGAGGGGGGKKKASGRPRDSKFGALYLPWLIIRDPFGTENISVPPSGHMAGIYANNDVVRGVHKAPANYPVRGAIGLSQLLTKEQQGQLNLAGVNVIRFFAESGIKVWGARTLSKDAEWRYVNVRRFFNMCGEAIGRGTQWVVFEPNDQVTRNSVIRDIRAYLTLQWMAGALVGATREQAFFVKCDTENNPQEVIDAGRLVVDIGLAVSKPAEFIVFRIGQWAGGTDKQAA
jgi:phage tail sheath protein FI